jgi:hypothetical protein
MSLVSVSAITAGGLIYQPYSDDTYNYYCFASPGAGLSESKWQIRRENQSTGAIRFANGSTSFNNKATNLAIVQALSYS